MFLRALIKGCVLTRVARKRGEPYDVVVSYDVLNTGLLGVLISRIAGIPLIAEVNGDYTDWSNYAHIANLRKRRFKRWLYINIATFVMRKARGIKLLYARQLDYFSDKLSGRRVVIKVFPNFLDVTEFINRGETRKVVIVGFPFAVKGIDIAIAAFKEVAAEFPDWRLEVLGWYPGDEKELLDGCIGGHPQISHHPPIKRSDMPEYIGRSGIVLCASRTEGFPRVIKEAMYASKPCVVSDVGGLPAAISNGVNGLIFPSENVEALASQLRIAMGNESLRRDLGALAREFAVQEYSTATYLAYLTDFVKQVLQVHAMR